MNPEKLLDAMQYLPDEMLEQTDKLRRRKTVRWQPLVAVAACLCLLLSVAWSGSRNGAKGNDGAAPEANYGALEDQELSASTTASWLPATVDTVAADRLTVTLSDGKSAEVLLTELENGDIPVFQPGQKIRLYLENSAGRGSETLIPYKIEIEEDTK